MKLGDTIFNGNQFKNVILNSTSYKRLILGVNLVWSYFSIAIKSFKTRILADSGTYEAESILEDRLQEITPNLFDSASLVITPNGVKTSKLYSIKPSDGTGDLTVVRNTSATRIDENGNIVDVSTNVPRIDYSNGSPAILVEPQRTNLILYSQDFDNATVWTILSTRFTYNKVTAPNGNNEAFEFVEVSATDTHNVFTSVGNRPTSTSGSTYTVSAFFKQGTRRYCGILVGSGGSGVHVFLDTTNWTITDAKRFSTNTNWVYLSSNIQSVGNGWYRLSLTFRTDAALVLIPSIFASNVSTTTFAEPSYLGNGSTIIAFGLQLEVGSNATSYIPTTTSSVTRNADVISKSRIINLIGQSKGSLVYYFIKNSNNSIPNISLSNNGTNPRFYPYQSSTNYIFFLQAESTAILVNYLYPLSNFITGLNKIGITYGAGSFKIYINGNLITSVPYTEQNLSFNKLNIGSSINNTVVSTNNNNLILINKEILSESEMIQLTTL